MNQQTLERPNRLKTTAIAADPYAMSILDSFSVEVRPSRPPTIFQDRRAVVQYRERDFPATAAKSHRVFLLNLEGGFFTPGALADMVVPVAQSIRSGVLGSTVLVVATSDDSTITFLEAIAERQELAFFIVPAPDADLSAARPVGPLTTTQTDTLNLLRAAGGQITSAGVARLAGIEPNAAANRMSELVRRGVVQRVSRTRREGDVFIDLLVAAQRTIENAVHTSHIPAAEPFEIPNDIRAAVRALAAAERSQPAEMLARAWAEFIDRHREIIEAEAAEVAGFLQDQDLEGLIGYANRYVRERAEEAAPRPKL